MKSMLFNFEKKRITALFLKKKKSDPYASQWALVALRNICLLSNDARQYIQQLKVCFFETISFRILIFYFQGTKR